MTEELSRNVELELAELICVENALSPSQAVTGSVESGVLGPGKVTCLKVGTAILEALGNQQPITVSFTEDELWQLRERVSIYTSQGANADLGLVIKSKIYQALLAIGNKRAAEAALQGVNTGESLGDDGSMSREEVDDAVRRWKEVSGHGRNMGSSKRNPWGTYHPGDDPEDETGPKAPAKS